MSMLLVGYDLNKPGQNYADLIKVLRGFGTHWHHLDSTWLVKTDLSPDALAKQLAPLIDKEDELMVVDVTDCEAAWKGFNDKDSKWLTKNM